MKASRPGDQKRTGNTAGLGAVVQPAAELTAVVMDGRQPGNVGKILATRANIVRLAVRSGSNRTARAGETTAAEVWGVISLYTCRSLTAV
jgi:hypothetical protein